MSHILVVKKNGEREPFSEEKVIRSMTRVGLPKEQYTEVLNHITTKLHDGITTEEIFAHIQEHVAEKDTRAGIRLNLKQAIFDLGPTGFPFEKYMERIFVEMGYQAVTDQAMQGECVNHEVDVLLEKDGKREMVEAKFHNQQGIKTDIHVMMYTLARYWDLREINHLGGVWVVTNTKLSEDAIKYAKCKGMRAIAWNYPEKGNLQDCVEDPALYPVTLLPGLSNEDKQTLLEANIVLVSDFLKKSDEELEHTYFIKPNRASHARESATLILEQRRSDPNMRIHPNDTNSKKP
jgi:hypothetical protein